MTYVLWNLLFPHFVAETCIENEEAMEMKLSIDSVQLQISRKRHLARPAPRMICYIRLTTKTFLGT